MTRADTTFVPGEPCIAYDQAGEGDIVLFLHWVDGNRSNWQDQSRAFVRNYHAAAWAARDYGASDDYAGPLDFGDFARDIVRLLDHLGAATAHIVGLSMWGGRSRSTLRRVFQIGSRRCLKAGKRQTISHRLSLKR